MDHLERSARNTFVIHTIDRAHDRREDDEWLIRARQAPTSRFIAVWQDQLLTTPGSPAQPRYLDWRDLEQANTNPDAVVFLGKIGDASYFAAGIPSEAGLDLAALNARFVELRSLAPDLDHVEAALFAQAKAMVYWHQQHRYCGRCGASTVSNVSGYLRTCSNPACGQQQFPRTDPAIIVRVTLGDEILLGRQPRWPKGRYSNIAGYVEPGESLETAVAREVCEETGIELSTIYYHSSQPWPFPTSLMLGFTATAATREIHLHDGELEDARWLTRARICEEIRQGLLALPNTYSISYHLTEDWFDEGDCGSLADLLKSR